MSQPLNTNITHRKHSNCYLDINTEWPCHFELLIAAKNKKGSTHSDMTQKEAPKNITIIMILWKPILFQCHNSSGFATKK